jgi:hypothetical protein
MQSGKLLTTIHCQPAHSEIMVTSGGRANRRYNYEDCDRFTSVCALVLHAANPRTREQLRLSHKLYHATSVLLLIRSNIGIQERAGNALLFAVSMAGSELHRTRSHKSD